MRYRTIEELIDMIDRPVKLSVFDLFGRFKGEMMIARGSQHNHQTWEGGYLDHVVDAMNIARLLYGAMNDKRKLSFTLSDALLVLFLHDIEKIFPNQIEDVSRTLSIPRHAAKDITREIFLKSEKIYEKLTEEQKKAIQNVEVEIGYSNTVRGMSPLATFCHLCDISSARIWFDRPAGQDESWGWRESVKEEDLWGV